MIIRQALVVDIPQLLPLMEQLGYPQNLETFQKNFQAFKTQEGYEIAVAEQDEKITGCVAWSKSLVLIVTKTRVHIEALVVDNSHRGLGIGRKLMTYVEDSVKHLSPCIIDLTSGLRRAKDGAHDFYKALGYHNEGYMAKLYLRKEI